MTLPFLSYFKRKPGKPVPVAPVPAAPPPVAKSSADRLSKTVVPNATRSVGIDDPFNEGLSRPNTKGPSNSGGPRVAFSMNTGGIPRAVALALEPKIERAISLDLADVIAQMPPDLIRPLHEGEATKRVLLKAAEIEKGMSKGKPTVSVATVYAQVPEIFLHAVPDADSRQVHLPLPKVLEQFSKMQLRDDQYRDQVVPQVQTPFLQVTIEDNSRFGITMEPIQTGELPPVRLQPATAENIAAAYPEANFIEKVVVQALPRALTPLRPDIAPKVKAPSAAPAPEKNGNAAPTRIPFKITPNGTDAPAPERVPASSGPSVPTSSPPAPTRIPFKLAAPASETSANPEPWLTKESFEEGADANASTPEAIAPPFVQTLNASAALQISLPLKPILQSLPPFQLTGDVAAVPDDAKLELPFSLVEAQLITGRVSLKPEQFAAALPEAYRGLFTAKEIDAPVMLPLQDVLKNMPAAALQIRGDQQAEEEGGNFATPFSAKAEEDAKRFSTTSTQTTAKKKTPSASVAPAEEKTPAPAPTAVASAPALTPAVATPAAPAVRNKLQELLSTDDDVDAKAVVAYLEKLEGVKACAVMFADGLTLAGSLPENFAAEGLCAMAPSLLQRVENHLEETKLGGLRAMTLFCTEAAVSFFMHDNLCLAALHAREELSADLRERLASAVQELSRKYSHPV
ncbi:MAG: hypothetical protein ACR2HH_02915 [Chthoniobacterales bacterium]